MRSIIRDLAQAAAGSTREVLLPMIFLYVSLLLQLFRSNAEKSYAQACEGATMQNATDMTPTMKHDAVYDLVPHQWMP